MSTIAEQMRALGIDTGFVDDDVRLALERVRKAEEGREKQAELAQNWMQWAGEFKDARDEARAVLKNVEWCIADENRGPGPQVRRCPRCLGVKPGEYEPPFYGMGHASYCGLKKALGEK